MALLGTITADTDIATIEYPNLQVLTTNYTVPGNSSLVYVNSLTLSNNVAFTIPSTSVIEVLSGGVIPAPTETTVKVSSNWTTTSAVLTNIDGLTFPAAVNSLYEVDVLLRCQSSETNGIRFALACSASGALGSVMFLSTVANPGTSLTHEMAILGVSNAISKITTANTDTLMWIKAFVVTVGNTGNITMQVLKVTGGTATIYTGSRMTVTKLN